MRMIGFVGIGIMGKGMLKNLVEKLAPATVSYILPDIFNLF